ncbi:GAK5 protein, partial [Dicrurus megarhynchus]|nr:GAK5 protein [Dicrurus megarhynchus]
KPSAFAALKGPSGAPAVCFGCGKLGHLKKYWFSLKGTKPKTPAVCPCCRKGCHFANQCHSKYDFEGHPIQGNQTRSAGRRHAQTQMPQPPQAPQGRPPQVFTQQLQAEPAWNWLP